MVSSACFIGGNAVHLFRSHFRLSQFVRPSITSLIIDGITNSDIYVKIPKFVHLKISEILNK